MRKAKLVYQHLHSKDVRNNLNHCKQLTYE
jgi:hypothetical protein